MRLFNCRKEVADSEQMYPKEITTDCALRTIALTRPKTVIECMKLRGTFPPLLKILSKVYVDIVLKFEKELLQLNLLMWTTKIRCQSQATKPKYHTSPHISPHSATKRKKRSQREPTPHSHHHRQLPNPPHSQSLPPTSATNGTTHNPTPPESSLPNTNPTPDTTLTFYMADTGLNEDEDEDEGEDKPECAGKKNKAELAYPQEEDKKRKRDSDQGVQTGSEKEEVRMSDRKRAG
ncbi:HRDC multi-domain protein [Pyrenophora teres f. maculata]|nr:HRDC multi-domain protein [Pyrenophora teres f. maculata]